MIKLELSQLKHLKKLHLLLIASLIINALLAYPFVLQVMLPTESLQQRLDQELALRKKELLARGIAVLELDMPYPMWIEVADFEVFLEGLIKNKYVRVYLTYREVNGLKYPILWVPAGVRARAGYTCMGNLTRTVLD